MWNMLQQFNPISGLEFHCGPSHMRASIVLMEQLVRFELFKLFAAMMVQKIAQNLHREFGIDG